MDFNWTPFGTNANWGFFIGIKSGVLSDIKWDKRSTIKSLKQLISINFKLITIRKKHLYEKIILRIKLRHQ
jgi:hypothetical protein